MNDLFAAAESDALRRAPQEVSVPEGSCPKLPITGIADAVVSSGVLVGSRQARH